jgi:hypothetical protein
MSEKEHDEVLDEVLVKKRARVLFLTWFGSGLFVLWMVISSALDMWSAWEAHTSRETIISCVTEDGECFKSGQARQAKVLKQLYEDGIARETVTRQIIILSDWCADQPGVNTLDEREKCVNEQLTLAEKERDNE